MVAIVLKKITAVIFNNVFFEELSDIRYNNYWSARMCHGRPLGTLGPF